MNECAVIILNYNTWQDTINEIEHIYNMFEIDYSNFIIVDNNSLNESYKKLSEFNNDKGMVLIKSNINGGYAKGNNIGLKYAYKLGYKYALIVNNDIEFSDRETLKKLINCMNLDRNLATINPDICSPTGMIYNRDAIRPSFFDMTLGMFCYIKKGRKLDMINDDYSYVYRPQGCCMLTDLKKLCDVNFFDEKTFLYNEENILAERLSLNNYKCACCVGTSIIHNHSKTIKREIDFINSLIIKCNSFKYYLKVYRDFHGVKLYTSLLFYLIKNFFLR